MATSDLPGPRRSCCVCTHNLNGFELQPPSVDEAVELVVAVAAGHMEPTKLCGRLAMWTSQR
jgi:hypothetical protein